MKFGLIPNSTGIPNSTVNIHPPPPINALAMALGGSLTLMSFEIDCLVCKHEYMTIECGPSPLIIKLAMLLLITYPMNSQVIQQGFRGVTEKSFYVNKTWVKD